MHNDGIEEIRHHEKDECPPGTHSDVPIIEGKQTVGLVCTICGRRIREDMAYSGFVVDERGRLCALPLLWKHGGRTKDPRF